MVLVIFFLLAFLHVLSCTNTKICDVEWIDPNDKPVTELGFINDTARGEVVAVYRTVNVARVKQITNKYFNITHTWKNETLTFALGENFANFESETEYTVSPKITATLKFVCIKDIEKTKTFNLKINDTNNNSPQLNQPNYNYVLSTSIVKGFELTSLQSIEATDIDVTNKAMYFKIPENQYLKIQDPTQLEYKSKTYSIKLVALQDIVAPFSQEFELTVTDSGDPPLSVTTTITVNVTNLEETLPENNNTDIHPPVFRKILYIANYTTSHKIEMEEDIMIKYGAINTTVLNQKGYETYFNFTLQNTTVTINMLKELPHEITDTHFIVIEIEAVNEGLDSIPGRTAVLIEFADIESNNGNECQILIFGQMTGYPMILMISGILAVIVINISALAVFYNKNGKKQKENAKLNQEVKKISP